MKDVAVMKKDEKPHLPQPQFDLAQDVVSKLLFESLFGIWTSKFVSNYVLQSTTEEVLVM